MAPVTNRTQSMAELVNHYEELLRETTIIKDRVRGVVHRQSTGMYLHGRPGISKTFMVRSTLEQMAVSYTPDSGHLTAIGLLDLIDENRDRLILIDDVSAIFNQPIALQFLLAGLGSGHDRSGTRFITHKTAKGTRTVPFSGGIFFLSNLGLDGHHKEILAAIRDRINVIHFDPSDEQIIALIFKLADDGVGDTDPKEARKVAAFVLEHCELLKIRPSVRLFVDKALKDYQLWASGKCEAHWEDLVVSNLRQSLIELQHDVRDLSRDEQIETERRIALDIFLSFGTVPQRVAEWEVRTGKKQATFYRRIKELRLDGRLPG